MMEEVEIQEPQLQQEPDPPKKKLWKSLSAKHLYTKSYEDFGKQFSTPESIDKLHKVLSEKQLYTKTTDDFKNQFFSDLTPKKKVGSVDLESSSLEAGNSLGQSGGVGGTEIPTVDENAISASKEYRRLKNAVKPVSDLEMGMSRGSAQPLPDEDKRKEADKLQERYKDYNLEEVGKEFEDFPEEAFTWKNEFGEQPFSQKRLLELRKENPVKYNDILSGVKTQYDIAKKTGDWDEANNFINLKTSRNVDEAVSNIEEQRNIINRVFDTKEEREKANERIRASAYVINPSTPGFEESYNNSGLSSKLTPSEYAGLLTLKAYEPEKYEQTLAFLNTPIKDIYIHQMPLEVARNIQAPVAIPTSYESENPEGGRLSQTTIDQKIGMETRLRELASIGRDNEIAQLDKTNKELGKKIDGLPDGEEKNNLINAYNDNVGKMNNIIQDWGNDDKRFPLTTEMKLDRQIADIIGKEPGLLNTMAVKFAIQADNPRKSFYNLFGDSPELQMQRVGESQSLGQYTYLPEELRRVNSPVLTQYPKEVEKQIKDIYADKTLNETEKKERARKILFENQDKITTVTNSKTGSKNFFSKATAYTMAGFLGDIGGMAFAMAANPIKGKPGEMIGLGSLMHNNHYTQAVEEGIKDPNGYANLHTGIDMLAATFGTQYDLVKEAVSKSPSLKNVFEQISKSKWDEVVSKDKNIISKAATSIKNSATSNAKIVALWGGGVPAIHQAADNVLYNKNTPTNEIISNSVNNMEEFAIGQLPLFFTHAYTGYKRESNLRKSMLWEIGDNHDIKIQRIKEQEQLKELTPQEAKERIANVTEIANLIKEVPKQDAKGKELTDEQRVEYLYNLYVKNKANSEKSLPEEQKKESEKTGMVADYRNELILNPPKDLEKEKEKLQNQIEAKDENGKPVLPEKEMVKAKAKLEAIDITIKEKEDTTKISVEPPQEIPEPITIKTQENAIRIESTNEMDVRQQAENGEGVGIGNAKPEIVTPKEESKVEGEEEVTGVKRSITDATRAANNLPKVEIPKMVSDTEALSEAKKRIDNGEVDPQEMISSILKNKSGYKDEAQVMDMQYYAHQLQRKNTELNSQLADAKTEEEKLDIQNQKMQLSDLIDQQTEAAQIAGNQWGKIGNRMQPVIGDNGQVFRENKALIKEAYGGEVPKDVQAKMDALTKQRDEAIVQRDKVEAELRQKMAAKGFEEVRKSAERGSKRKQTKEELKAEEQDLINQLKQEFKGDENAPKRSGSAITDKMVLLVGKLAVNYAKQGIKNVEEVIDKIYTAIKSQGYTRQQVQEMMAQLSEIERLNKKAETLENKLTPPSVDSKGRPVPKPDFAKPSKVYETYRKSTEWVKANQRVADAEFRMKIEKRKALESKKNMYQRALMWLGRVTRLSVLSGTHVLEKLASAATIGSAVKRVPEQAIGAVYSQVFKGIAKQAQIEGFTNAKSEAKFYKEFFNPKKFVKNAWEILKTGSSPLSRRLGSAEYEHVPIMYLPTDTHQIIKDPPKRATFEASFRNGLIWAEKNGLDINDPLVINSIENAAYKRAQYEIFQEQNWLSKKFTSYKSSLEKAGNTGATAKFLVDFMIPVSTVPTNIVRRVTTTSPLGLIRGGKEVIEAYRKGIEKLSPEKADHVMQQLKQGTLGTALWLVGWFGYESFGGLYSQFNPNKKREEGDKESDVMIVGGKEIPKPTQHALPLEVIQMAATARRIYENYRENKNATTPEAIYKAGLGSIGAGLEQIPVISTGVHAIMATKDPIEAEKLKEDVDRRLIPQFVRERMDKTKGSPELKFLMDKELKIVPLNKEGLSPIDENGKRIFVTDNMFNKVSEVREEKIKQQIALAMQNGFINWDTGETIPADKITKNQLRSWLMKVSTKAKNEAIDEVFGTQPEKVGNPNIDINQ